jgi:hypothetical protein
LTVSTPFLKLGSYCDDNYKPGEIDMRLVLRGLSCAFLAGIVMPAIAAPAPDIVGKSVVVSWSESRHLRREGQERTVNVSYKLSIYLSSNGRPFTRMAASSGAGAASNDTVGGSGSTLANGARGVTANGHSVSVTGVFGSFAHSVRIEVGQGGSSCAGQVVIGKEAGGGGKTFRSAITGKTTEVLSATPSALSCSVQAGNVFAQ